MKKLLGAALGVLLCAVAVNRVDAAEYRLLSLDGSLVKWGVPKLGMPAVVTYALADRELSYRNALNCKGIQPLDGLLARYGVSRATFEQEMQAAFKTWEKAAKIRFRHVSDPATAGIVIGAQIRPRGRAYTNVDIPRKKPGSARIATIRKSLICLNPAHGWKVGLNGDEKKYDLRFTLIHEIGHAIGLDHSGAEGQIMGFRYTERYRTPQRGDIRGVGILYGSAETADDTTSRTALSEPELPVAKDQAQPQLSLGEDSRRGNPQ